MPGIITFAKVVLTLNSDSNVFLTNHASRQRGNTMFKDDFLKCDIRIKCKETLCFVFYLHNVHRFFGSLSGI